MSSLSDVLYDEGNILSHDNIFPYDKKKHCGI